MSKRKRRHERHLPYKRERLILSDVLPFEVPLTFSNRHFYDFLTKEKISVEGKSVLWKEGDAATERIIRLIFGLFPSQQPLRESRIISGQTTVFNRLTLPNGGLETIPFSYQVKHKDDSYRELALCHPRNQVALVEFFDQYKETILYHCSQSPFSIRKPVRLAKSRFFKDRTHYDNLASGERHIEEYDKEYESLRSFFVYKEYDNVHKFYDSEKFLHCEKKFRRLLKLDISKCFSSIYTHTLPWALLGKEEVKSNRAALQGSFGDRFDRLIRSLNRDETNGIIIGPEFSRIFAEIILQAIDKRVCSTLARQKNHHRSDYEIFRYVDDYFIFYESEAVRDAVIDALRLELKDFKLYLNDAKRIEYCRPIITDLSRAKRRIIELLDQALTYDLKKSESEDATKPPRLIRGPIWIDSTKISTAYKAVVAECGVREGEVLNWTLSIFERRLRTYIRKHRDGHATESSERAFLASVLQLLSFLFFIYSAAPRVNTTIRLCRVLNLVIEYFRAPSCNPDSRDLVFQRIYEDVRLILRKSRNQDHVQVETLYFLHSLAEMGKDFLLDEETLMDYFSIERNEDGSCAVSRSLNYFSIVVSLFYIRRNAKYRTLRECLEAHIISKFQDRAPSLQQDAEMFFLFFDVLACPFLQDDTKRKVLELYKVDDPALQAEIIAKREYWFTKWTRLDIPAEIDMKLAQEVY